LILEEARLPPEKVQRLTSCFTEFKGRRSCTLRELQSLIGSLNFACKVIPPSRPFLQRMIQLTRNVSFPHDRIKSSQGFFKDLRMWEDFICNWNGAGFFIPGFLSAVALRDLKVAQSELVCQLQYPTSNVSTNYDSL